MLLELIRSQGTPRDFLSYDAVMSAIEKWGLGWRLRSLLRMQHEKTERSRYGTAAWASADGSWETTSGEGPTNASSHFVEGDTSWFDYPPTEAGSGRRTNEMVDAGQE
eukprot:scaffold31950_cov112-Isochrysis_galbana.AAC.2